MKQMKIIISIGVILFAIVLVLSVYTVLKNEKQLDNKLLGTWYYQDFPTFKTTFYSNGTSYSDFRFIYHGNWRTDNGVLYWKQRSPYTIYMQSSEWKYTFSDDKNTLYLTEINYGYNSTLIRLI